MQVLCLGSIFGLVGCFFLMLTGGELYSMFVTGDAFRKSRTW